MIAAATEPVWAVTPEKLREAVRRLVDAAHPRRIILFGSRARGDAFICRADCELAALRLARAGRRPRRQRPGPAHHPRRSQRPRGRDGAPHSRVARPHSAGGASRCEPGHVRRLVRVARYRLLRRPARRPDAL